MKESGRLGKDAAAAAGDALRSPVTVGVLVTLFGLLATSIAAWLVMTDTRHDVVDVLDRTATDIDIQVHRRLEVAESALGTMAAQISTGAAAEPDIQWVLSTTGVVEDVPGLLAMLYAPASEGEDGLVVAPRAVHPLAPNVGVLGRNVLTEPERRRAILAARDSGMTTATSIVTHVDGGVDAILVVTPVYEGLPETVEDRRAAFLGVVFAVVSPRQLFADVARLPVVASVVDLGAASSTAPADAPVAEVWASEGPLPEVTIEQPLRFADRIWNLTLGPGEEFPVTSNTLWVVIVAGSLMSVLLGVLAWMLTDRRERLEDLVDRRTAELRRSNAELARADRLRAQFITTVSHELRTPLTSVLGYIQTVRRMGTSDPATREDFLARAERNGLMLRRMIEELLDFGRLERNEMVLDRRPMDVGLVVGELVRDVRPALGGRELVVRAEEDTWAEVDRDALERIVANVLSNAVQHAPNAGPIELVVRSRDSWIELLCCDRGPGFDPDDIPVLFERFVRGTGVMGEGTGIGLALVNELTLAQGGEAELRNRPDGGAEVIVRLPAQDVADGTMVSTVEDPIMFERSLTEVD